MLIAALFVTDSNWNQPQNPSRVDGGIKYDTFMQWKCIQEGKQTTTICIMNDSHENNFECNTLKQATHKRKIKLYCLWWHVIIKAEIQL